MAGIDDEGGVVDGLVAVVADHLLDDQIAFVAEGEGSHADVAQAEGDGDGDGESGDVVGLDLEIGGDGFGSGEAVVGEFDGQIVIEMFRRG